MARAKLSKDILRIMKENEKYANMLEEYDRTGEFPLDKNKRKKASRDAFMPESASPSRE